jgi:hypothetical protein
MNQQLLFKTLFNKNETDSDANSFLKNSIDEFPYFGLAHFYALKQTAAQEGNYAETAAKTNLFFNNPYFLQAQILDNKKHTVIEKELAPQPIIANVEIPSKSIDEINIELVKEEKIAEGEEMPLSDSSAIDQKVEVNNTTQTEDKKITVENTTPKEALLFEPLHASDYFASQGIKLSENALGNDKLGLQLKSFTSWLKTMKKVHPEKLPMVTEMVEKAVQSQAAKSNIEAEIVTEAMAEAYILQDKQIRAIEVYEKLSLLNPSKSAYFASKIDQLKK